MKSRFRRGEAVSPEGTRFQLEANHLDVTAKRQIRDVGHMLKLVGKLVSRGVRHVE